PAFNLGPHDERGIPGDDGEPLVAPDRYAVGRWDRPRTGIAPPLQVDHSSHRQPPPERPAPEGRPGRSRNLNRSIHRTSARVPWDPVKKVLELRTDHLAVMRL